MVLGPTILKVANCNVKWVTEQVENQHNCKLNLLGLLISRCTTRLTYNKQQWNSTWDIHWNKKNVYQKKVHPPARRQSAHWWCLLLHGCSTRPCLTPGIGTLASFVCSPSTTCLLPSPHHEPESPTKVWLDMFSCLFIPLSKFVIFLMITLV